MLHESSMGVTYNSKCPYFLSFLCVLLKECTKKIIVRIKFNLAKVGAQIIYHINCIKKVSYKSWQYGIKYWIRNPEACQYLNLTSLEWSIWIQVLFLVIIIILLEHGYYIFFNYMLWHFVDKNFVNRYLLKRYAILIPLPQKYNSPLKICFSLAYSLCWFTKLSKLSTSKSSFYVTSLFDN